MEEIHDGPGFCKQSCLEVAFALVLAWSDSPHRDHVSHFWPGQLCLAEGLHAGILG
jgi:hypothetical protein